MTGITRAARLDLAEHHARRRSAPVDPNAVTGPTCYHCRQAGQPVEPVILTLRATNQTPPDWPREVQIDTYACIDREMCRRLVLTYAVTDQRVH